MGAVDHDIHRRWNSGEAKRIASPCARLSAAAIADRVSSEEIEPENLVDEDLRIGVSFRSPRDNRCDVEPRAHSAG